LQNIYNNGILFLIRKNEEEKEEEEEEKEEIEEAKGRRW